MDQTLPTNPSTQQAPVSDTAPQTPVTDPAVQMPAPVPPASEQAAPQPMTQESAAPVSPQTPVVPTEPTAVPTPAPEPTPAPVSQPAPVQDVSSTSTQSAPSPAAGAAVPPIATTPAAQQPPVKKGGIHPLMILLIILFVMAVAGGAYYLAQTQLSGKTMTYQTPTVAVQQRVLPIPTTPVASQTAALAEGENVGTVSGTLCYPGSSIPAGTITAKSTTTNKEFTQAYPGMQSGAKTTYTMNLAPDTYHMKFTPTQSSTTGYYTEYSTCVDFPSEPNCTGTKVRAILPVSVTAGQITSKINLCDYYYPTNTPPQY